MTETITEPAEAVTEAPSASQEVIWTTAVTPSGIEIRYQAEPKRGYQVRSGVRADGSHNFDWRDAPSVTTVLGVLDKSAALTWWGQKIGVAGVIELVNRGLLVGAYDTGGAEVGGKWKSYLAHEVSGTPATLESVMPLIVSEKLSTNHARDKAGDRGISVHDAFETWCVTGNKPDPSIFPDEERGYVEGLNAFLDDVNPEPYAAEVMVGSVEHGFAGRYDARIRIPKECQVVFHRTPKRGPQYATLKAGVLLGDLKTSKGVYMESHGRQLEAYELASVECGYDPTTARGILHVNAEGGYELVRSICTGQDFLDVLKVWNGNQRIKGAK